jgi:chemotaxis signal transduction protein
MSEKPLTKPRPVDRVEDLPRIQEALTQSVREALRRHKQAGNPVAIWQDGAVVWIAPEDILVDDEDPQEAA